jgi:hypothetical protein
LFCNRPLTGNDTHTDYSSGKNAAIDITYLSRLVPGPRPKTPVRGQVFLERKVGNSWYYVSGSPD